MLNPLAFPYKRELNRFWMKGSLFQHVTASWPMISKPKINVADMWQHGAQLLQQGKVTISLNTVWVLFQAQFVAGRCLFQEAGNLLVKKK